MEEELVLHDGYEGRWPLLRRKEDVRESKVEGDRVEGRDGRKMGRGCSRPKEKMLDFLARGERFHHAPN